MNSIKFSAAVCSNKGRIRSNNEDNFYLNGIHLNPENRDLNSYFEDFSDNNISIYGVFDGMGGEAMGEEASLITATTIKNYHNMLKNKSIQDSTLAIRKAIEESNLKICNKMIQAGEHRIGTTFSAICIEDNYASIFNIGDSRIYLYRDNSLLQLSIDDTSVQRLINMGLISKEEAKTHSNRHKLSQHLGIFKDEMLIEPHIIENLIIKKGDIFVICSDGLTDMVEDSQILTILKEAKNASDASKKLVETALKNGGEDNVTVVVVEAKSKYENKNGKIKLGIIIFCFCVISFCLCISQFNLRNKEPKYIEATEITIDEENYISKMQVDDICYPMPQRFPVVNKEKNEIGETKFHYESSDPNVVLVDNEHQKYTALKPGKAVVTISMDNAVTKINVEVVKKNKN